MCRDGTWWSCPGFQQVCGAEACIPSEADMRCLARKVDPLSYAFFVHWLENFGDNDELPSHAVWLPRGPFA